MRNQLSILILVVSALLMGSCKQKEVSIPQEGDVAIWKHNSALIIKTKLGPRRKHVIVNSETDHLSYEPQYELFVGQFPIDYVPERFPKFTKKEQRIFEAEYVKALHARNATHSIEFSLMLHGAKVQETDRSIYSKEALDDVNQVKVVIESANKVERTASFYKTFKETKRGIHNKELSIKYGMDCYMRKKRRGHFFCFGESSYQDGAGVFFTELSNGWVSGESIEPVYDGIKLKYRIDKKNLKHWQAVDGATWRLLEHWNVSTAVTINSTIK